MQIIAKTHVGMVRDNNEDCFFADNDNHEVFIVADGMGGHLAGEIASNTAVETALKLIKDKMASVSDVTSELMIHWLNEVVEKTNEVVYRKSFDDDKYTGMGTTMVMVVIKKEHLYIAHIGDSSAYLIKDSKIEQITKDHTLVQALVDSGSITMEEARMHPKRNILTRALGTNLTTKVDVFAIEKIEAESILLMCTDGLTGNITDEEINRILNSDGIAEGSDSLITLANERGGQDNVTLLIVQFADDVVGGKN